jgi:hypothetical protein
VAALAVEQHEEVRAGDGRRRRRGRPRPRRAAGTAGLGREPRIPSVTMVYEHTQSAPQLPFVVAALAIGAAVLAAAVGEPSILASTAVLAVVAVVTFALSALTTTVTPDRITVAFRWGRPRRAIPVEQVVRAEVVRNHWLLGWGIRWVPGATMFNVWGLDAVHLDLDDARDFRIGTDDPEGLVAAIDSVAGRPD